MPNMGCCVFLRLPSNSRLRYHALPGPDGYAEDSTVKVVVGKERRVFDVDPFVLEEAPFRFLMETMREKRTGEERQKRDSREEEVVFADVDAILFEHLLWLVYNDCSSSSLLQLNLKDIIEFYSQDS